MRGKFRRGDGRCDRRASFNEARALCAGSYNQVWNDPEFYDALQ